MKKTTKRQSLGQRMIRDLTSLRDTLRQGEPLERRFTVRQVNTDVSPRPFGSSDVRELRDELGLSQAVFAQVCGVSLDLVQSWEQGVRKPGKMACRLLEFVERDRQHVVELLGPR